MKSNLRMRFLFRSFLFLVCLFLSQEFQPAPKAASSGAVSPWSITPQGKLRLIAATTGIGAPDEPKALRLGLEFDLLPGWKIYWHSPGEAGMPPIIDWSGSENLSTDPNHIHWHWPVPERFTFFGMETVGYKNHVVLPIDGQALDPSQPVSVKASVSFLVCSDICVPQSARLSLDLESVSGRLGEAYIFLQQFRMRAPAEGIPQGFHLVSAIRSGRENKSFLRLTLRSDQIPWKKPDIFIEGDGSYGRPHITFNADGHEAIFELEELSVQPSSSVSAVIVDGTHFFRVQTEEIFSQTFSSASEKTVSLSEGVSDLWWMLLVALLGGLILNVMPCVLPVLSLKALGILRANEQDRKHVRLSFLASAGGILVSFWLLACLATSLKTAGIAVGWGIQFQQPLFLAALILILFIFAANLLGLFEFSLPTWLGGLSITQGKPSLSTHFFSGVLATLLATPCSAPFVGTAVGFALAGSKIEILAIFTALGLGLSLPYIGMALWPGLVYQLPRPGKWMITLRRSLGIALLLTAVWLGSALAYQLDWLKNSADTEMNWQPLDPSSIPTLLSEGKVVFVDVTAEWCLTCKFNKIAILEKESVQKQLLHSSVVRMRGDWTKRDEAISEYLATFGRYGIPFNAVYSAAHPAGHPLSELLTEKEIIEAIDTALKATHQIR